MLPWRLDPAARRWLRAFFPCSFLQITCDDAFDLAVPGQKYTFGVVKGAQARGDFEVLLERKRRALRAHLGADVAAHLATLQAAFISVLRSRATSSPDLASLRRT